MLSGWTGIGALSWCLIISSKSANSNICHDFQRNFNTNSQDYSQPTAWQIQTADTHHSCFSVDCIISVFCMHYGINIFPDGGFLKHVNNIFFNVSKFSMTLASSALFQILLSRWRSRPSARLGSSVGSHPAGEQHIQSVNANMYSGALILHSCSNICTHVPDVVFRNSLVHISTIGPVDHYPWCGVTAGNKIVRWAGGSETSWENTPPPDQWIIQLLPVNISEAEPGRNSHVFTGTLNNNKDLVCEKSCKLPANFTH